MEQVNTMTTTQDTLEVLPPMDDKESLVSLLCKDFPFAKEAWVRSLVTTTGCEAKHASKTLAKEVRRVLKTQKREQREQRQLAEGNLPHCQKRKRDRTQRGGGDGGEEGGAHEALPSGGDRAAKRGRYRVRDGKLKEDVVAGSTIFVDVPNVCFEFRGLHGRQRFDKEGIRVMINTLKEVFGEGIVVRPVATTEVIKRCEDALEGVECVPVDGGEKGADDRAMIQVACFLLVNVPGTMQWF